MLGRLISEVGAHSNYYSYDIAGNRTGVIVDTATVISYNYNSNGEVDKIYDYDAYGNVSKTTYPNSTFN